MEINSLNELINLSRDICYIIINFNISKLIIPDHIIDVECCGKEVDEIICSSCNKLKYLFCHDNNIKNITIPSNLLVLDIRNNILENIYAENNITNLHMLDISNNNITDFTLKLPKSMANFYIKNNPGIRMKHWNFVFGISDSLKLIDSDIDEVFFNGELRRNYKLRDRLEDLHEMLEYITYEDITKKWKKHYKNISYDITNENDLSIL